MLPIIGKNGWSYASPYKLNRKVHFAYGMYDPDLG